MHSNFISAKILSALILAGFAASSAQAQLVTNGGFETGDLTGWSFDQAVASSNFTIFLSPSGAHSGNYAASFASDSSEGSDGIAQNVATTPGAQYQFSFWAAPDDKGGLAAYVGGQLVLNTGYPGSGSNHVYQLYSFNFTATSPSTQLLFYGGGSTDGAHGAYLLDDVAVTPVGAVPEPSQWALMALGLAAIGVVARRQRSVKR